jgi:hypothetical protein
MFFNRHWLYIPEYAIITIIIYAELNLQNICRICCYQICIALQICMYITALQLSSSKKSFTLEGFELTIFLVTEANAMPLNLSARGLNPIKTILSIHSLKTSQ